MMQSASFGPLALIGGGEWLGDDAVDRALLELGGDKVLVLPTAAAYEQPGKVVDTATERYASLGATTEACMLLNRTDAEDEGFAGQIRNARFIYLSGGSPLHLRVVLKDSLAMQALRQAWRSGAVVAGSSAGAMALSDPMVDPRGGAFTVGLGMVLGVAVVPHFGGQLTAQLQRTVSLATDGCAVVALAERTGVIRMPDGTWSSVGPGPVEVYVDGKVSGLSALAGKRLA